MRNNGPVTGTEVLLPETEMLVSRTDTMHQCTPVYDGL